MTLYILVVFVSFAGLGLYYNFKAFQNLSPSHRHESFQIFRSRGYIGRDYFTATGWKYRILGLILPPLSFVISILLWLLLQ
ncbi:MAG: hypothetical protein HY033_13380 [Ignavibacteriae bacterium]|nr:hypothetical protein [Ignavibacteria bacterium]MBI3365885.1 hypothetical protein [Ignavibacteriota bacterium]